MDWTCGFGLAGWVDSDFGTCGGFSAVAAGSQDVGCLGLFRRINVVEIG